MLPVGVRTPDLERIAGACKPDMIIKFHFFLEGVAQNQPTGWIKHNPNRPCLKKVLEIPPFGGGALQFGDFRINPAHCLLGIALQATEPLVSIDNCEFRECAGRAVRIALNDNLSKIGRNGHAPLLIDLMLTFTSKCEIQLTQPPELRSGMSTVATEPDRPGRLLGRSSSIRKGGGSWTTGTTKGCHCKILVIVT